jgi:hypothetical protein
MVLLASTYDQSKFLKAQDLTTEKKFKIKSVTAEEVGAGRDKEKKLVVWFSNDDRGLVLNKTNNRTLRGAFGDDCAGWAGKIVVIFPTMAEFRGDMKPCLRVRIPPPKGNGYPVARPPTSDDPEAETRKFLKEEGVKPEVDDDFDDEIEIR